MPYSSKTDLTTALLLGVLAFVCPGEPAGASDRAYLSQGREIFNFYCYQCHGYAGDAQTVAAAYLRPRPLDFSRTSRDSLTREAMIAAVRNGKAGTAMMSFARVLDSAQSLAVVDYIRGTLMSGSVGKPRYHTTENGWPGHERYSAAFPFATGALPIDTPWETLNREQRQGRRMFVSACATCHEGRSRHAEGLVWEPRAVSFPRSADTCLDCHLGRPQELLPLSRAPYHPVAPAEQGATFAPKRMPPASPYPQHARAAEPSGLTDSETRGRALFLANCAFCHAADGTGRNWIGSFLEPGPRDLSDARIFRTVTADQLRRVVRDGVQGTSMPAWKDVLSERQIADVVDFLRSTARSPVSNARSNHPAQ